MLINVWFELKTHFARNLSQLQQQGAKAPKNPNNKEETEAADLAAILLSIQKLIRL